MVCYRIVESKDGKLKSLFHGTSGTRILPIGEWIAADKKIVKDGTRGTEYESGFHVLLSAEAAHEFFNKRFRIKENRIIIRCEARNLRPKIHALGEVYLADSIKIDDATPVLRVVL